MELSFFNEKYADIVQLVSLPLTIIGLLLALIELFRPAIADKIESSIDNLILKIQILLNEMSREMNAVVKTALGATYKSFAERFIHPCDQFRHISGGLKRIFGYLIIYAVFFFLAMLKIIQLPLIVMDKIAKGRALGGLGLALAITGLVGECYQVATMFLA